jgi:large subunit ribosomal protein L3
MNRASLQPSGLAWGSAFRPLTEVEIMTVKAIVGEKVGMTQIWDEDNNIVPVTVVKITPCRVVQIKSPETDGYSAIQVTTGNRDAGKLTRPEAGHFAKYGVAPGTELVELRLDDVSSYSVGQELTADLFATGDLVDAVGTSKGKGFAGVMKRHNFAGQRATHGAHLVHRMPGSIGQCATPSRVFKGQRMAGHMGNERTTTQNLKIVQSDAEQNLIMVKGAVPGPKGGTVILQNAVKASA